jgi:peroxiredoxin
VRDAADFLLDDARGGQVRLSDQRGNVVLLCFWSTWSASSVRLLEALGTLTEQYGQNVLFLTVAMDRDRATVRSFLRREQPALHVLYNDGLEKAYRLEGVPAVFLVDREGRIQFSHKGFRKDIASILSIEIDDLLGATSL